MKKRPTALDKAIQKLDDQITVLAHAREVLVNQRAQQDTEQRRAALSTIKPTAQK